MRASVPQEWVPSKIPRGRSWNEALAVLECWLRRMSPARFRGAGVGTAAAGDEYARITQVPSKIPRGRSWNTPRYVALPIHSRSPQQDSAGQELERPGYKSAVKQ